jgi:hypothetical protein
MLSQERHLAGPSSQAFITRTTAQDMDAGAFDRLELWANSNSWIPFSDFNNTNPAILFDFMASETTLQYHHALNAWFVVIVNSFVYGPTIMIHAAASPNGTWSKAIPVFTIPSQFLQQGDFCYAGKVSFRVTPLYFLRHCRAHVPVFLLLQI